MFQVDDQGFLAADIDTPGEAGSELVDKGSHRPDVFPTDAVNLIDVVHQKPGHLAIELADQHDGPFRPLNFSQLGIEVPVQVDQGNGLTAHQVGADHRRFAFRQGGGFFRFELDDFPQFLHVDAEGLIPQIELEDLHLVGAALQQNVVAESFFHDLFCSP